MLHKWKISGFFIMIAFISLSAKSCFDKKETKADVVAEVKTDAATKANTVVVAEVKVDTDVEENADITAEVTPVKTRITSNEAGKKSSHEKPVANETKAVQKDLLAKAFYYLVIPGAQQVDENGNAVDNRFVRRFIILETESSEAPKVVAVLAGNKKFTGRVVPLPAENGKVLAGQKFLNAENIYLPKNKNTSVWRVDMNAEGFREQEVKPLPTMLLSYTQNGKRVQVTISRQEQLVTPLYP